MQAVLVSLARVRGRAQERHSAVIGGDVCVRDDTSCTNTAVVVVGRKRLHELTLQLLVKASVSAAVLLLNNSTCRSTTAAGCVRLCSVHPSHSPAAMQLLTKDKHAVCGALGLAA